MARAPRNNNRLDSEYLWLPLLYRGDWVPSAQFREQREIPVTGKQFFHAMRDTDGRDTGVMDDPADHPGPLYEPTQQLRKVGRFSDETIGRRRSPGGELTPGLFLGRGVFPPDSGVGHYAEKFVAARPRYRPNRAALRQGPHKGCRCQVLSALPTVRVNQDISVDGNQRESGTP